MSDCTEINIKEGMPLAADAIKLLEAHLELCRKNRYRCVVIVHGYGSTGKGGTIRQRARSYLKKQKEKGKLRTVIYGENMTIFNQEALDLKQRFSELGAYMGCYNEGITIVEL